MALNNTTPPPGIEAPGEDAIQDWLIEHIARELELSPSDIDVQQAFSHHGLSSTQAVSLSGDLERWLQREVPPTAMWDFPTIELLARHLAATSPDGPVAESL